MIREDETLMMNATKVELGEESSIFLYNFSIEGQIMEKDGTYFLGINRTFSGIIILDLWASSVHSRSAIRLRGRLIHVNDIHMGRQYGDRISMDLTGTDAIELGASNLACSTPAVDEADGGPTVTFNEEELFVAGGVVLLPVWTLYCQNAENYEEIFPLFRIHCLIRHILVLSIYTPKSAVFGPKIFLGDNRAGRWLVSDVRIAQKSIQCSLNG